MRARFITDHEEYRISDAPFAIPAKLGRSGLSEVINHLLGNEGDSIVSFDFCIKDILVRVPLHRFLTANNISTEDIVQIEYMPASTLSDEKQTIDAPAWVGCLDCRSAGQVLAGCYDGSVELLNANSKTVQHKLQAHADPVRSIASWAHTAAGSRWSTSGLAFATGSKDQTVKCWSVTAAAESGAKGKNSGKKMAAAPAAVSVQLVATLKGHTNSVEAVEHWESRGLLLSGDWAGNLMAWNVRKVFAGDVDGDANETRESDADEPQAGSRKRLKQRDGHAGTAPYHVRTPSAVFTLKAHAQSVSAIQVAEDSDAGSARVFTCSWDHGLKVWDMDRQDVVAVYTSGSKICTSMHYNHHTSLVGTSHSDGKLRLWDVRQNHSSDSATSCQSIVNGGTASSGSPQWVSQLRWHPSKSMVFGCTDYAGVLRVWDIRSTKVPMGQADTHDGKALCLDWADTTVFSGGSDCVVQATLFQ